MNTVADSGEMLTAFVDCLPWPAMVLDDEGWVIYRNKAMVGQGGQTLTEERKSFRELYPEYYSALTGEAPWSIPQETRVARQTPAGIIYERLWLRRFPQHGALLIVTDETRLQELETGNAQTARLASLGFMLAGVCHEVSNPLAATYSMVQILQSKRGVSEETLMMGLANIAANVKRILEVSRKLNDFSRVGDDEKRPINVDWAVEEALALLYQDPRLEDVELRHEQDREAIVQGDVGQLRQVFYNILINALQAMEGRGEIKITTRHTADKVEVTIQDNGPGIPPECLAKLFDPFFTTKPSGQGTGLGLAISYEIVHEHGGTIHVENNPDRGACFRIELPLRKKAYEKSKTRL